MKRLALFLFAFFVMPVSGSLLAQSVKIDFLANDAGKIHAKCTVTPNGKPIDRIHLFGVPSGGGQLAIGLKMIQTTGNQPFVVELKTNAVGGQIAYECFAVIAYKEGNDEFHFSSKKSDIFVTAAMDTTNYGNAALKDLDPLGAGKVRAKIHYTKAGDWRARNEDARIYFLPKDGGRANVFQVEKVAGKDEWNRVVTVRTGTHFVFARVYVFDVNNAGQTKAIATNLKRGFVVE